MKTKILIAMLSIGLFTMSTVKAQEKPKMKVEQMEKTAYACPMKCEGEKTYEKAGSCPKCKMDLKKVENAKKPSCCEGMKKECDMTHDKMDKTYSCPMHADIKSDKPGSCSKCGMNLKEKKMEMKKEK
ncbi:MAG TPA: heavy metal-binding domain-containing protein [Lutibacter sp.]|nr:heavy metal-binding domain-containing protein [Lutibacter sp.]